MVPAMTTASRIGGASVVLAHGRGRDWRAVARELARQLGERDDDTLGFLYVTDHLGTRLSDLASYLVGATGVLAWYGTVGMGICGTGVEYYDEPAAVALACRFPGVRAAPFRSLDEAVSGHRERHPSFVVVHGDPRRASLAEEIARLASGTDGFLVGGLTSSRGSFAWMAESPVSDALSGVVLTGAAVATGLTQGCLPLGGVHEVTEAEGNLVRGLDGRPALDVFVELLAEEGVTDLARLLQALHVALPVAGSDTGDYLVRNLVGLDPERRVIAVAEPMSAGDALMFCRRDRQAAEHDLRAMLAGLKARARRPLGGLYFSCLARGAGMFGSVGRELGIIREELGDLPLAGFFGNGEISFDRLYAYTGVLALFLDSRPDPA